MRVCPPPINTSPFRVLRDFPVLGTFPLLGNFCLPGCHRAISPTLLPRWRWHWANFAYYARLSHWRPLVSVASLAFLVQAWRLRSVEAWPGPSVGCGSEAVVVGGGMMAGVDGDVAQRSAVSSTASTASRKEPTTPPCEGWRSGGPVCGPRLHKGTTRAVGVSHVFPEWDFFVWEAVWGFWYSDGPGDYHDAQPPPALTGVLRGQRRAPVSIP